MIANVYLHRSLEEIHHLTEQSKDSSYTRIRPCEGLRSIEWYRFGFRLRTTSSKTERTARTVEM